MPFLMEIFADPAAFFINVRFELPIIVIPGACRRITIGQFRLEITPELCLRDRMYSIQQNTAWKDIYIIRFVIEATISELNRAHGIGRLQVRRAVKICFAIVCKVTASNIKRWAKAHTGC
ncbi:MAG: hypothetical protein EHM85_05815 [Desulfobacteraceae bacterium]|nr:MAG: hypothetical protein EHM85_05815 [Desulfobacteraceae bacterium]